MALLADFGSSLFADGKASANVSIRLAPTDVTFNAHSLVLEHRSPLLASKLADARRNHRHSAECDKGVCRLSIRLEHPFEVSLDTFNTFLRFLYAGNLEHVPQLAPATVTSLMLLVQWYKLQLVDKRDEPRPGIGFVAAGAQHNPRQSRSEKADYLQQQERKLHEQQQMVLQQKRMAEQQQRQLQNAQKDFEKHQMQQRMEWEKQQQQLQQQQARQRLEYEKQVQHQLQQHLARNDATQQRQHPHQHQQPQQHQQQQSRQQQQRSQAGILGAFPSKMQNLRISGGAGAPSAKATAVASGPTDRRKDSGRDRKNERQRKVDSKPEVPTQKAKSTPQDVKNDDSQRQQQRPQQRQPQKKKAEGSDKNVIKNLELRVTNLTPGVFKHVLAERLRREFGTPCKVTWLKNESAFVWLDYQVGRKVLAEKPRVFMGRSTLNFSLTKKFKLWPMQLRGVPAQVSVEELQKVFLKNDSIINVEYFPKGPRRRESRTYLHFTDKESLRAFVNSLTSFYIHHGNHTLKWEIACGDSSLEKGAFDVEGVSWADLTDDSKADLSKKIKTACQQKFGHVFIVKLVDMEEGLIYFEKKFALENFGKMEELAISGGGGLVVKPKKLSEMKNPDSGGEARDGESDEKDLEEEEDEEEEGSEDVHMEEMDGDADNLSLSDLSQSDISDDDDGAKNGDEGKGGLEEPEDKVSGAKGGGDEDEPKRKKRGGRRANPTKENKDDEECEEERDEEGEDEDDDEDGAQSECEGGQAGDDEGDTSEVENDEKGNGYEIEEDEDVIKPDKLDEKKENSSSASEKKKGRRERRRESASEEDGEKKEWRRQVEIRFTDLPLGIFKSTLAEELEREVGASVKIKTSKGNSAFVWIPVDVAKKILSDHPVIKVSGNPVKISLASNFKKWILHINEFPDSAKEETKQFLLQDPFVVEVVMSQKPKRAVAHFINKGGLLKFLTRYSIAPMNLPSNVSLKWDLCIGDSIHKASFEIFVRKADIAPAKSKGEILEAKISESNPQNPEEKKEEEVNGKSSPAKSEENDESSDQTGTKESGDENDDVGGEMEEGFPPSSLSSIERAASRAFKAAVGEVFFVRFHVDAPSSTDHPNDLVDDFKDPESVVRATPELRYLVGGTVYFQAKTSRQKFLDGKELCVSESGVEVVVLTKEAAAAKKKEKFPGSYPD